MADGSVIQQRALLKPNTFIRKGRTVPGKADPISRSDLVYYGDIKNRGYLALAAGIPIPVPARRIRQVVEQPKVLKMTAEKV